ncbi:MAG: hypothetical protein ACQCN6_05130 [Candidatus Bathyarchaeia archaeon]
MRGDTRLHLNAVVFWGCNGFRRLLWCGKRIFLLTRLQGSMLNPFPWVWNNIPTSKNIGPTKKQALTD